MQQDENIHWPLSTNYIGCGNTVLLLNTISKIISCKYFRKWAKFTAVQWRISGFDINLYEI
jgi:hypothetical protein